MQFACGLSHASQAGDGLEQRSAVKGGIGFM